MPRKTQRGGPNAGSYYEDRARQRKAYDFGEYLHGQGVNSDLLARMSPQQIADHAALAGIKDPSTLTMNQVHNHLQAKARFAERAAAPDYDPFAGL